MGDISFTTDGLVKAAELAKQTFLGKKPVTHKCTGACCSGGNTKKGLAEKAELLQRLCKLTKE
jgi:hypothetical protein